jgi:hypothetical protein
VEQSVLVRPCELNSACGDIRQMVRAATELLVRPIEWLAQSLRRQRRRPNRAYADHTDERRAEGSHP